MRKFTESLGADVLALFHFFGDGILMLGATLLCIVRGRLSPRQCLFQMSEIGVNSLPIILLTVGFSGMVLAIYASAQAIKIGMHDFVGGAVGLAMAREIAPVIGAVVIASRAGSSIAAELGSMVVTQQVDALRSLAVSPTEYLVVPRLIAVVCMLPVLVILALVTGMYGGMLVAQSYGIPAAAYLDSVKSWVTMTDVWVGLIKTIPFALIIAIISCHQGLGTQGGAQGVGRAVTSAVVMCIVLIYAADYFLSSLLPQ